MGKALGGVSGLVVDTVDRKALVEYNGRKVDIHLGGDGKGTRG